MTDKRWKQLGEMLVNYSLKIKPGEKLMIMMQEVATYPLTLAVYEACIKAGGLCQIQFMTEEIKHKILKYGNEEQISWVPEIEKYGMEWADCYLALRGAFNMTECYDVSADKLSKYQKAMGVISGLRWKNTRWALVRVPNERFAQTAGISYEDMMDMFFNACNLDWEEHVREWTKVCDVLNQGTHFRIVGENTDIEIDTPKNWIAFDNTCNIPDGEISCSPVWKSVNGHIWFNYPATIGGKVIHNLELTFNGGVVTDVKADDNVDYVWNIIKSDENSNKVGEFAFGTNPYINVCTTDILMDEKIYGSMHIALGRPYDGNYYSAIHWDIIKSLKENSVVYLDGEEIYRDGEFLMRK